MLRYYGLVKDVRDDRDLKHVYRRHEIPNYEHHDLSGYVSEVYDQESLGSCSANAVCAAYLIDLRKESEEEYGSDSESESESEFMPSRLFLYYNARSDKRHDTGASLRDTIKAFHKFGVCSEEDWSYDPDKLKRRPLPKYFRNATKADIEYKRLRHNLDQFRACISDSCPFVFGMKVFSSFESQGVEEKGNLRMPSTDERRRGHIDSHAVVAVAYNDRKEKFKCLNSWGEDWGVDGYFYMPYEFIMDQEGLCFDFWKISFSSLI